MFWPPHLSSGLRQVLWAPSDTPPARTSPPAIHGLYGILVAVVRLVACRCRTTLWLATLWLAACLLGTLVGAVLIVALTYGPNVLALWHTVAVATAIGLPLRAATALRSGGRRADPKQDADGCEQHREEPQSQLLQKLLQKLLQQQQLGLSTYRVGDRHGSPVAGSRSGSAEACAGSLQGVAAEGRPAATWAAAGYCASSTAATAYAAALRAVHERGLVVPDYVPIGRSAAVHLRVGGMQPEQLRPGWQSDLERRCAEQGWCILNAAVRRGSTCISLTLVNLRAHEAAAAAAGLDAHPDAAPARRGANGRHAGGAAGNGVPLVLPDPDSDAVAGLIGGPEELLAGLGMRRQDLSPDFSFTVQAFADDGRRHRARYTWQQNGTWLREPLDVDGPDPDPGRGSAAAAAVGGTDAKAPYAAVGPDSTSRGPRHGADPGPGNGAELLGSGQSRAAGSGGSQLGASVGVGGGRLSTSASQCRWILRAPYVLLGRADRNSGSGCLGVQRYEAEVEVSVEWDVPGSGDGCDCADAGGDELASGGCYPWDGVDLAFRVRQLGWPCEATELRLRQAALARRGAEPTRRSGRSPRIASERGSACGLPPQAWRLTVWDEPSPATADLPAVAMPPRAARRCGGTDAGGATGVGTCGARLVDLSAWLGEELLAAHMLLLVPHGSTDPRVGGGGGAAGCWASQLQGLLAAHPPEVAQHILLDLGLLLSGAFDSLAPKPPEQAAAAAAAAAQHPTGGAAAAVAGSAVELLGASGMRASSQLVLLLDLGTCLTSLVLRHGCCDLAELLWASLERLGFGAEEVLLHSAAGGAQDGGLPLLHAAAASGEAKAAALVLSWYATAGLPEPWLQPVRIFGSPAVLTPLVLASAASPSGALPLYILRNHPQALAAWPVVINGASGRSVAAAAGLWTVVLEAEVRVAVASAAAAAKALGRRVLPRRLRCLPALCRTAFGGGGDAGAASPPAGIEGGVARASASAFSPGNLRMMTHGSPAAAGCKAAATAAAAAVVAAPGKDVGAVPSDHATVGLDTFVAQRTRARMLGIQLVIVLYQLLAQLKALVWAFEATCPVGAAAAAALATAPAAASHSGWAWLRMARVTGRCVGGRLWWTGVEAALAAAMASPVGVRHHALCCAAAAAARCLFQGFEGVLLPPGEMRARGTQLKLAHSLFVMVTACCYQAPSRLNVLLRLAEGFAATRMYVRYGVTTQPWRALVQVMGMETLGWLVSAALRWRSGAALRRQQQQQQQRQQQ